MQMGKFITLRQIFFLLYLSKTAGAPFFLTLLVIPEAGMSAWQLLLLDCCYVLLGTFLVIKLAAQYPAEYCITYLRKLLGKWGGTAIICLLITYFLFEMLILGRGVADICRMGILPTTPQWVVAALLFFPAAYAAATGITTIARVVDAVLLFGVPVITLSFAVTLPNIYPDFITNLWMWRPEMFVSLNFISTFCYVSGFIILYVLYPFIQATPRQIMGSNILALVIATVFMYIPVVYVPMLVLGPEGVLTYRTPLYATVNIAPVNLYIVEHVSIIFYSIWIFVCFIGAALNMFCAMHLLFPLLPIHNGLWLIPMFLVIPLGYLATFSDIFMFMQGVRYAGMLAFFLGLALPALLFFIHALRQRKEQPDESMENM